MKLKNAKTPKFYTLPTIHQQGNPGKLVVDSINSRKSNLSKFVENYLQTQVENLHSYVKDITSFIKKVRNIQEDTRDTILQSMDLKSLYANIRKHEGMEAVKEKLIAQRDKPIATKVIVKFLFQILTLNNFIFNSINYLQINGCAMGTIITPPYARGKSDNKHLLVQQRQSNNVLTI